MFKSARWKNDKPKIKIVFKLQFQVTQVPQTEWDTLMLSLIHVDIGRPTVRSEKFAVRDGACRWERPICEAIKFSQEAKTGKFNEKIYKVIVSSGSSKTAILGEATIDFSEYADAIKAAFVSFPLKNPNSGAVLHVVIQRMHGDVYQREVEENIDLTVKSQDVSLKKTVPSENAEPNGNLVVSRGYDATSTSGSESSSERNTPRELGLKSLMNNNNNNLQDPTSFLSSLSRSPMPHKRSSTEWSVSSAPDGSTDDSTNSSEDNLTKERFPQASDLSVEKLKSDLVHLARQAEVSELELQTLRKQIMKETKKGQDLSREVVSLKEERDALRKENEQFKSSQKHIDETKVSSKLQLESEGSIALVKELGQELNHEKDLNVNLRLQLQKTQESNSELILAVQDLDEMLERKNREISNLSKNSAKNEVQETAPNHETSEDEEQQALEMIIKEHDNARDVYLLEQKTIDLYNEIDMYQRDRDEHEMQMEQLALDYEILKQENHDLYSKLKKNRLQAQFKTQSELETQIENLEKQLKNREEECSASLATISELEVQVESLEKELKNRDEEFSASSITINELKTQVEILKKELKNQQKEFSASLVTINELEAQVKSSGKELKNQEDKYSASLDTISELETQVKSLEKELEKQVQGFVADLEDVTRSKVEQEKRAIRAEEALRKTRWANANTAERLQEEFRRLSMQMAFTFDANEKFSMKAVEEANEIRLQKIHLEELLEKANEEIGLVKDQYEGKLKELLDQIEMKKLREEKMLLELDKSKNLEYKKEHEEEIREAFSKEILVLKAEIERLRDEKNELSGLEEQKEKLRIEMETMKTLIDETKMLVQTGNAEKDELERRIVSVRKEAQKSLEELNTMRSLKDEKETMVGVLKSEVETLRVQHNELRDSLFGNELENEKLRKQVSSLRSDLQKKEAFLLEEIKSLEGQIQQKQDALESSTKSFLEKEMDLCNRIEELKKGLEELNQKNNTNGIETRPIKRNNEDKNLNELLRDMELLKKRNKSMESELKDMQGRYSEISLKFAEVEGERQQLVMTVRNLKNCKKI